MALGLGATPVLVRAQIGALPGAAGKSPMAAVNLNSADEATLQSLPGVGPALSKQIVAGRPFTSVDDLAKVKGIGPAKLAALRKLVTVGGATATAATAATTTTTAAAGMVAPPSSVPRPAAPMVPTMPKTTVPAMPSVAMPSVPAAVAPPTAPAGAGSPSLTMARSAAHAAAKLPAGVKVNLNTATEAELESLPGIGPVKAKAIVAGRPYSKPEDVMKVPGIKQGIFNKIKDAIAVP